MEKWKTTTLGEVLERVIGGGTPSRNNPEYWNGEIPWASVKDMQEGKFVLSQTDEYITIDGLANSATNLIPTGTVITSTRMGLGRVFKNNVPMAINQDLKALFPKECLLNDYLLWLIASNSALIKSLGSGTTVKGIRLEQLRSLEVSLPPLPIQRRIASILSAYDELIENSQRRIKILEEMARALYREWFVHFRFPGWEGVPRVASPLGEIPEGWEVKKLGEIAEEVRRNVPKGQVEYPIPYVGLEHIPRRSLALDVWEITTELGSNKLAFKKSEVLFGKIRPYFHKVSIAPFDGLCSSDTIVIRSIKVEYYAIVVGCVSSDEFVAFATATSNGSKMPRANWSVVADYPVTIPSLPIARQFSEVIESIIRQMQALIFQIHNLRRTRDLLLPRLLSGQIDLSSEEALP